MKSLLALLFLLACTGGCFIETHEGHHGREAVVVPGHLHCDGCGHVQVKGIWYVQG